MITGITWMARLFATFLIFAHAQDGSLLVTADSREGMFNDSSQIVYDDHSCKIHILRNVVFVFTGESSRTEENKKRDAPLSRTGWNAIATAKTLVLKERNSPTSREAVDRLARSWADAIRVAAGRTPSVVSGAKPIVLEGFFATSGPGELVYEAGYQVKGSGRQISVNYVQLATIPDNVPSIGFDMYGSDQATAAGNQAMLRMGFEHHPALLAFSDLKPINLAVANSVEDVGAPFDEVILAPDKKPEWRRVKAACK